MKSILVVDDEHDILLAVEMLLSEEGYEVRTARNGREALERLAEKLPSVIMMDVMMPVLSGPDTLKIIKQDADYSKIPVILMSAVRPAATQAELGWSAFLRKPFEIDRVLQVVAEVLPR